MHPFHLAIPVNDLDTCVDFYKEIKGKKLTSSQKSKIESEYDNNSSFKSLITDIFDNARYLSTQKEVQEFVEYCKKECNY